MDQELIAYLDKRFEQIDRRFEQIDKLFEQVDKRFEQVDKRFSEINERLDDLDARVRGNGVEIEGLRGRLADAEVQVATLRAERDIARADAATAPPPSPK